MGTVMQYLRTMLVILIVLVVAVSVGLNVYFLMGKGIQIDRSVHTHQEQYQSQATLVMPPLEMLGLIEWRWKYLGTMSTGLDLAKFLNTLSPEQAYMGYPYDNYFVYPVIKEGTVLRTKRR